MNDITFVSGLYRNIVSGKLHQSDDVKEEVRESLRINPHYGKQFVCYADTKESADYLREQGCRVHRILDDAPSSVVFDTKHKMKQWIMYNAAREFGNVVWVDWDTYNVRHVDSSFVEYCLRTCNPKFTRINKYWATVNCSVYYLSDQSLDIMRKSFSAKVDDPNDELMWRAVLPCNVSERPEYWLGERAVNIWVEGDFQQVTANTYFLHLKDFSMLKGRYL